MRRIAIYLLIIIGVTACRTDDIIIYSEEQDTGVETTRTDVVGMYVLCEGNMGSNKCTVDYLDLLGRDGTIRYLRNIYAERNPNEVKELGDVGNDVKVNGSQLWLVINCSHKVEVCTVDSCRKRAKIDIPNCRYVTFHDRYAYVSSYVGPVSINENAPRGRVYKVDTLTFQKVDSVVVGYQPEELAVVGGKLYVANSGGYRVPDYDRTVSVVDLATFREERQINVAPNLHRLRADKYGQLWVTSRGDYFDSHSKIYCLRPDTQGVMQLTDSIDTAASDLCLVGDSLYFYGSEFSFQLRRNVVTYGIVNVGTHQLVTTQLTQAPEIETVEMPYGIIVNPQDRDFYIMDAKNYVSSGELLHFRADGSFDYRVWTGDIPGHAAFVIKETKK